MTDADLSQITKQIDSLVVSAASVQELYRKLNVLTTNGSPNWQLLRAPLWVGSRLIAVVVKPDVPEVPS